MSMQFTQTVQATGLIDKFLRTIPRKETVVSHVINCRASDIPLIVGDLTNYRLAFGNAGDSING